MICGARIPFNRSPPLILPTPALMNKYKTPVSSSMTCEITTMLKNGILEPAPLTRSFISPMFLIQKGNGKNRVIFNLKGLNRYMKTKPFRLFHHHQTPKFLQPGDWMAKLDISQAYYHLSIRRKHRCYLRLSYKDRLYQMTCLPFGLATAPRMFASITNWTAEIMRSWGFRVVVYLDDYFLVHQSRSTLSRHVRIAINFLTHLGWCINLDKSVTTPTKVIEFLGIAWDTQHNTKSLPKLKILKIRQSLLTRLAAGSWSLKQAQRLLGYLNFATFITHRGRLHCRTLQRHSRLLRRAPRAPEIYPEPVRAELKWWLENVTQSTPIHPIRLRSHYVVTDASDVQWGAVVDDIMIHGSWKEDQQHWHCNLKEMHAVISAITNQASLLKNSRIILQSDNQTVVSYIKNEGGTRSLPLLEMTKRLLALVDRLNVVLCPHYLPGVYNTEADQLSRNRSGSEWHLKIEATQKIFALWGTPEIDLFASQDAHVVPNYVSRDLSDSSACYHDAFSRYWHYELGWIFPPPCLIPRVLQHLNRASGRFIIIAPRWEKPFWQPDLKNRALSPPMKVQNLQTTLIDVKTNHPPVRVGSLQLEAWQVSGGIPLQKTGPIRKKNFFYPVGERPL